MIFQYTKFTINIKTSTDEVSARNPCPFALAKILIQLSIAVAASRKPFLIEQRKALSAEAERTQSI